jgi:hypothetical protein
MENLINTATCEELQRTFYPFVCRVEYISLCKQIYKIKKLLLFVSPGRFLYCCVPGNKTGVTVLLRKFGMSESIYLSIILLKQKTNNGSDLALRKERLRFKRDPRTENYET